MKTGQAIKNMDRIRNAKEKFPSVAAILAARPHPRPGPAGDGLTLRDYVDIMFEAGSLRGRIRAAAYVEEEIKNQRGQGT